MARVLQKYSAWTENIYLSIALQALPPAKASMERGQGRRMLKTTYHYDNCRVPVEYAEQAMISCVAYQVQTLYDCHSATSMEIGKSLAKSEWLDRQCINPNDSAVRSVLGSHATGNP